MKKGLCLFLIIMTICAGSIGTFALESHPNNNGNVTIEFEQSIIDEVCSQVVETYEEYYTCLLYTSGLLDKWLMGQVKRRQQTEQRSVEMSNIENLDLYTWVFF